jgi:small conductance mechanosensitive channel
MDFVFFSMATFWNVVFAILILIGAWWLSGVARHQIQAAGLRYEALDDTLFNFLSSLARYAILALGAIFVLNRFGIQTTSLVAIIGAAGLAIGLALQGTLSNIAAGIMLMIFRPFKLGDYVEAAGVGGTVSDVKLFTTELTTLDNLLTIVPNAQVWNSVIVNYSTLKERRLSQVFSISYEDDINKAMAIVREVVEADERVLTSKDVFVGVTNLGDSSVDLTLRAWCASSDYFAFKCDMLQQIKQAFDENDITIPYPTQLIFRKSI